MSDRRYLKVAAAGMVGGVRRSWGAALRPSSWAEDLEMRIEEISQRDAYISTMAESLFSAAEALTHQGYYIEAHESIQKAKCLSSNQQRYEDRLSIIVGHRVNVFIREERLSDAENILRRRLEWGGNSFDIRSALFKILLKQADRYAEDNKPEQEDVALCKALLVGGDDDVAGAIRKRIDRIRASNDYFEKGGLSKELQFRTFHLKNKRSLAAAQQLCWIVINRAAALIGLGNYVEAECLLWEAIGIFGDVKPTIIQHLVFVLYQKAIRLFNAMRFSETELTAWELLELDCSHGPARQLLDICARHPARMVINIPDDKYTERSLEIRNALTTKSIKNAEYVRIGRQEDGGYVMAKHALDNKIVYSLGVGHDVSWDMDMAKLGCTVFQYDHTIDRLPAEHPNFKWSRTGIAGRSDGAEGWSTLEQAIQKNGHQDLTDMILKIDIEGSEWSVISETSESVLRQFTQIVGEYHALTKIIDGVFYEKVHSCLNKINKNFVLAHVHVNNISTVRILGGVVMFSEVEFLYVRDDVLEFSEDRRVFPTTLDYPVRQGAADYRWNY